MDERSERELRCVDPSVGERILDLALPTVESGERNLLEAHAEVCAHCRLALDLHHHLAGGRDSGEPGKRPARPRGLGWAAAVAAAATIACLFLLPPRALGPSITGRGPDDARILRPVEGEVVAAGPVTVSWTAIPGVDEYGIRVADANGNVAWTASTRQTDLIIPADVGLERGRTYRILLSTVPADLLPPGGASVRIRVDGPAAVAAHRVRYAPWPTFVLAVSTLLLVGAFAMGGTSGGFFRRSKEKI